eukprot:Partr_v1_DN27916_c2_g1_i1_m11699 putative Sarcosine oxidase
MNDKSAMTTGPANVGQIAIIGAGIFGVQTAIELRGRGYDVTVFDRASSLPASDAASTDINKAVRLDYGDQSVYTQLSFESILEWRVLERGLFPQLWVDKFGSSRPFPGVFSESGWCVLNSSKDRLEDTTFEWDSYVEMRERGVDVVRFRDKAYPEGVQLADMFPAYADAKTKISCGYFNPVGGYVRSGLSLALWTLHAQKMGVKFQLGADGEFCGFQSIAPASVHFEVRSGRVFQFDHVIVACGAWSSSLVPELRPLMEAHGQPVMELPLDSPALANKYSSNSFPAFAWDISRTGLYGFSATDHIDTGKQVLKIGCHGSGYTRYVDVGDGELCSLPLTRVDDPGQTIPRDAFNYIMNEAVVPYLPDLVGILPNLRMCWYCDSFDGNFVMGRLPHSKYAGSVSVCAGGSGHGFKFAPLIGKWMSDAFEMSLEPLLANMFQWREPIDASTTAERAKSENGSLDLSVAAMAPSSV